MKPVFTYIELEWDGVKYTTSYAEYFKYDGPVILMCGASSQQKQIGQQQQQFFTQMTQQASTIFGDSSKIFGDLVSSFAPIVAAGPNQEGFDAQTLAALDSQAITSGGNAYRNASTAAKEASAAVGGGNVALPSGASIGRNAAIATSSAANTANNLVNINLKSKELGRENYFAAANALSGAPNVFGVANSAANTAIGSGQAAADTANQIAQADNAWMGAVGGILGGVAGGVVSGGMSNIGKGAGFFGQNAPAPTPS